MLPALLPVQLGYKFILITQLMLMLQDLLMPPLLPLVSLPTTL